MLSSFYRDGSGEHDTFMMAAAVVYGSRTLDAVNPYSYAFELQFLFYYVFDAIASLGSLTTSGVLLLLNVAGALCSLAAPFLMWAVLARAFSSGSRARVAVLLFVSSPLYFFIAPYGHPFHISLLLFLVSWLVLSDDRIGIDASLPLKRGFTAPGLAMLMVAIVLQSLALMIRFEQVALMAALFLSLASIQRQGRARRFIVAAGVPAMALAGRTAVRSLIAPSVTSESVGADGLIGGFGLLARTLDPSLIGWGVPHMVVEVGLPLLLAGGLGTCIAIGRKRPEVLAVTFAGVLPSVFVYIGNPSPPRHFVVLAFGLACVGAMAAGDRLVRLVQLSVPLLVAVNLTFPWLVGELISPQAGGRSTVTYNVVERGDRNRAEIDASRRFSDKLLERARQEPIVLIAGWVHMAQIAARVANDPAVVPKRETLVPGVEALGMVGGGLELYVIETYDPEVADAAIRAIRETGRRLRVISIVTGGAEASDVDLEVPAELYWWSAEADQMHVNEARSDRLV